MMKWEYAVISGGGEYTDQEHFRAWWNLGGRSRWREAPVMKMPPNCIPAMDLRFIAEWTDLLNLMGRDGWELVMSDVGGQYIFKRPLP